HRLIKENIDPASAGPSGSIRYDIVDTGSTTEGYDKVGNRLSRTVSTDALTTAGIASYTGHTFNSLDHLDTGASGTPIYDANGNTTAYSNDAYSYDAENRLIKRTHSGASEVVITYDAFGNRVKKVVVGTSTTTYLVEEHNPTGYAQVIEER